MDTIGTAEKRALFGTNFQYRDIRRKTAIKSGFACAEPPEAVDAIMPPARLPVPATQAISHRLKREFRMLNDALLNTALLGAIGALAYWLRDIPLTLMGWLSRYAVSSLSVDSRDPFVFTTLVEYLEHFPDFLKSNQITAHSRKLGSEYNDESQHLLTGFTPEIHLSPAPGFHLFRVKGRWLMINRSVQVTQTVLERITLSQFGRDSAFLRQMVKDAVDARVERESRQLSIYMPDTYSAGEWMRVRIGNRRALSSVILKGNLAEDTLLDIKHFFGAHQSYSRLGIPWRRGYLLYGPPGTGKTSMVSALASELHLNICTFSLASPLITDEKIHSLLAAVPRRSILLIEDVDAFFHQRDAAHEGVKLSFSGFLNALDGVATQEGSVLFMTTNHPEDLDPALIRSGRIDMQIELGYCDADQMRRLFLKFHDDAIEADKFVAAHRDQQLSPAAVQDMLLRTFLTHRSDNGTPTQV